MADLDTQAALEFAHRAVQAAQAAGASQAEARLSIGERFSAEARDRTITKLEQSASRALHMRVFVDGRKASLVTSDFEEGRLDAMLSTVVAQARCVEPDQYNGLPENVNLDGPLDLDLYSEHAAAREASEKIEAALELEELIRRYDARITNSNGSSVGDTISINVLVNSQGFAGSYRSTRLHCGSSPVAQDGDAKRTGSYGTAARHVQDAESVERVASMAVRRTVELFGARKPPTMRVPVIFERDVASTVLSDIFAAVSAANVAIGNSWLAQRLGTRIGSELVTVVDDGTLPRLLGSSPFDGEGVPTQRNVVISSGTLQTFLCDTYYARKLGARSTGNASGSGVGPNNFYLAPGTQSLEDLIGSTGRGVLVLDTIGFATEHATGTYSRGARGFLIEGGERAYPIEEFTIAASFPELLAGIDAVASDLRFDGSVVSPSFRVAEMTISGD